MASRTKSYLWGAVFAVLMALAIPWFLWGNDTVVAGFPVWLWWHIGWMGVAAVTFAAFARDGWGVWMDGWSA